MTMDQAIKAHMARVDAGDMEFHRRVGNMQELILRMTPAKKRAGMLDEAFRQAVEAEIRRDEPLALLRAAMAKPA